MTAVEVRRGQVSARLQSPNREITDLVKRVVPPSGRSWDGFSREWVIAASRVPALLTALRAAGVGVVESKIGGGA